VAFNSAFKGLKLLKKNRERAFKQFKWPRPQSVKNVQFTDINSCTVRAVQTPPNTYHVIFPEIRLALHRTNWPPDLYTTYVTLLEQRAKPKETGRSKNRNK